MQIENKFNRFNPQTIKQSNKIKLEINKKIRKGSNVISEEKVTYKEFDFNHNLHSDIFNEEMFTNYVRSYENNMYLKLEELFDKIYYKKCPLSQIVTLLENEDNKTLPSYVRLERIVKKVNELPYVPELMKFVPIYNNENKVLQTVRLYVYYDKNSERFELFLIDLYHLGIDAKYKGRYDLSGRYRANIKNKKCISKISDKYCI